MRKTQYDDLFTLINPRWRRETALYQLKINAREWWKSVINWARGCKLRCTNYFMFNIKKHSLYTCSHSLIPTHPKVRWLRRDKGIVFIFFTKQNRANLVDNILIISFCHDKSHTLSDDDARGRLLVKIYYLINNFTYLVQHYCLSLQ